jgi:hypothetical protein
MYGGGKVEDDKLLRMSDESSNSSCNQVLEQHQQHKHVIKLKEKRRGVSRYLGTEEESGESILHFNGKAERSSASDD